MIITMYCVMFIHVATHDVALLHWPLKSSYGQHAVRLCPCMVLLVNVLFIVSVLMNKHAHNVFPCTLHTMHC